MKPTITRKDFMNGVALAAGGALLRPLDLLADSARQQRRTGRLELYTTPFETFERNIREQLTRMLGPGGFDPQRDLEAITVNRWPHGYADFFADMDDPDWPQDQLPNVVGRQPFGRISIANSDAAAAAQTQAAIDEAYRAVQEVIKAHASA